MIRVAIDASVDGQYGAAGIGVLWVEAGEQQQLAFPLEQHMDNHEAEFWALFQVLTLIKAAGKTKEWVVCQTDSKIVYEAVQKQFHKREPYKSVLALILPLLSEMPQFNLKWVSEQQNRGADRLARQAMHKAKSQR